MKKHFNKELVMTKKDNEDFKNSTKYSIFDNNNNNNNNNIEGDIKVRDHCHITRKYRGSSHRDRNVNVNLNRKILIVFHNLINYDSHLIIQELGKFTLKINVIPNGLEKYMSFSIYNKSSFFHSYQFSIKI